MTAKELQDRLGKIIQQMDPRAAHEGWSLDKVKTGLDDLYKEAVGDYNDLEEAFDTRTQELYEETMAIYNETEEAQKQLHEKLISHYKAVRSADIKEKGGKEDEEGKKDKASGDKDKVDTSGPGHWVTSRGKRIFIPEGETRGKIF